MHPVSIELRQERLDRALGVQLPMDEAAAILQRLDFKAESVDGALRVTPPDFRLDCTIEEDLIEEVARMAGYDRVPSTLPGARQKVERLAQPADPADNARQILAGLACDEVVTYPLGDRRHAGAVRLPEAPVTPLVIGNPVAETRDALRLSLLGGIIDALALNARHDHPGTRLFEISSAFWPKDGTGPPEEPRLLAMGAHISQSEKRLEVMEVRSLEAGVRLLVERLAHSMVTIRQAEAPGFHPGRTGQVLVDGQALCVVGEIHPMALRAWELKGTVLGCELRLDRLLELRHGARVVPLPRFFGVRRDLTVVVRDQIAGNDLAQVIRELGGYTLRELSMLNEYEGPQLGPGARSLSFRLEYGRDDRSMTGEELAAVHQRIVEGLKQRFGVEVAQ
jgi:phenylalanyl-tRNA synthetase beta chain